MKLSSTLSRWIQISLAMVAMVLLVRAASGQILPAVDGGLQMSVNTGAYRVYAGDPVPAKTRARNLRSGVNVVKTRDVLITSVHLANRSPHDLQFTFTDEIAAQRKFTFRVFNSEGEEIWTNDGGTADAAVEEAVTATLRKRSKWSTVVQIPLKLEGVWLAPGIYTIEASLAGEPKIGATTLFEVAVPPTPNPIPEIPRNTGIKGQVLRSAGQYVRNDGLIISPAVIPHGIKAAVLVQQMVSDGSNTAPFMWQGETTEEGLFEVDTPPGRFRVQVTAKDLQEGEAGDGANVVLTIPSIPPQRVGVIETTVKAGTYSELRFVLSGGTRYEQPRADTGIKGQVFIPTTTNEIVAASGANVVVEELREEGGVAIAVRPRFHWTGKADVEGRFHVNTPPGRFRVAALWLDKTAVDGEVGTNGLPTQLSLPLRGSKEIPVVNGQFSDVRLDLKSGLVEIGTRSVYSVSSVEIRKLPTFAPPTLLEVSAKGVVNTGGWSNAQLRQRRVTTEGIIEFDFVAKPPEGVATQAFEPIEAVTRVPQPSNFRGVRVFAQTNSKDATDQL